jgi:DNA invertase Pin-like site-specific DNA recombinase
MIVGYARTSTVEQEAGFEAQKPTSKRPAAGSCSPNSYRRWTRADHSLTLPLSSSARATCSLSPSSIDLRGLWQASSRSWATLSVRRWHLPILTLGLDTSTATGRLTLNIFSSVAQFERKIMLERQREGIAKAKAEGKYKGRRALPMAVADRVKAMKASGCGATEIADVLKIGRATVYRVLENAGQV